MRINPESRIWNPESEIGPSSWVAAEGCGRDYTVGCESREGEPATGRPDPCRAQTQG